MAGASYWQQQKNQHRDVVLTGLCFCSVMAF